MDGRKQRGWAGLIGITAVVLIGVGIAKSQNLPPPEDCFKGLRGRRPDSATSGGYGVYSRSYSLHQPWAELAPKFEAEGGACSAYQFASLSTINDPKYKSLRAKHPVLTSFLKTGGFDGVSADGRCRYVFILQGDHDVSILFSEDRYPSWLRCLFDFFRIGPPSL